MEPMAVSKKKLLIVDDDADMRRGLSARLKAQGYETTFAADAVLAVSTALREDRTWCCST
jgi:CheY-like chemotaxis protein